MSFMKWKTRPFVAADIALLVKEVMQAHEDIGTLAFTGHDVLEGEKHGAANGNFGFVVEPIAIGDRYTGFRVTGDTRAHTLRMVNTLPAALSHHGLAVRMPDTEGLVIYAPLQRY